MLQVSLLFYSSPKIRTLAKALKPAFLRFGGTRQDFMVFSPQRPQLDARLTAGKSSCGTDPAKAQTLQECTMVLWHFALFVFLLSSHTGLSHHHVNMFILVFLLSGTRNQRQTSYSAKHPNKMDSFVPTYQFAPEFQCS